MQTKEEFTYDYKEAFPQEIPSGLQLSSLGFLTHL